MTRKMAHLLSCLVFASCHGEQSKDNSIIIPIDTNNVVVVNQTDENGKKQGQWQELDTINLRIAKEFYYRDDLLDSTYLVYKTNSADTLIFGYYKLGNKNGEWRYWDTNSNRLDKIELYENDVLKETKRP